MMKRLAEATSAATAFLSALPSDVHSVVGDCLLNVFDRYRLSRTCHYFARIFTNAASVQWIVNLRCNPCGSYEFPCQCQDEKCKPGIYGIPYLTSFELQTLTVRLLYDEKTDSFVFRNAEPHAYAFWMSDGKSDIFQIRDGTDRVYLRFDNQWAYTNLFFHDRFLPVLK